MSLQAVAEETGVRVTVQPKLLVAVITALETGTWVGGVSALRNFGVIRCNLWHAFPPDVEDLVLQDV